jgi:hypothetical protein
VQQAADETFGVDGQGEAEEQQGKQAHEWQSGVGLIQ